jgi:hypothetical protein
MTREGHLVLSPRFQHLIQLSGRDGDDHRGLGFPSVSSNGRRLLRVRIDQEHFFSSLLGRDGRMNCKRRLPAAVFLA